KPNVIMKESKFSMQIGLKVGDTVSLELGGKDADFTIVGISGTASSGMSLSGGFGTFTVPLNGIRAGISPTVGLACAQVDEAPLNDVVVGLSSIRGFFPLDVGFIDSLIERLLSESTAIPSIVAVLSLFAGAVIIANTVSLATLERRREVGVMKSIGMHG